MRPRWRLPPPPLRHPKHLEDRHKALAALCQAVAGAVVIGTIVAPMLGAPSHVTVLTGSLLGLLWAGALVAALAFLRYIPYHAPPEGS